TARAGAPGEALNAAEQRRGADRCLRLSEAGGGASPDEIAGQGEFEPRREAEPLDRGQRRARQFFEVGNRSQMASNPLTSAGGRSSLENADVGASREDLAFSPNQQGSEWGLLCRSHGASQVFDELLAEQVQGGIRQREYPESARGLEAHLSIHHCLLPFDGAGRSPKRARVGAIRVGRGEYVMDSSTATDYPTNTTLPKGRSSIRWRR